MRERTERRCVKCGAVIEVTTVSYYSNYEEEDYETVKIPHNCAAQAKAKVGDKKCES